MKTNRFATSHFHITINAIPGSPLCPVPAIRDLFSTTNHKHTFDALFSYRDHSEKQRFLDPNLFTRLLKEVLTAAGIESSNLSIHSFRRGAATFASSLGIGSDQIKAQGHWKSSCFQQCISRDENLRQEFSSAVSSSLLASSG